MISLSTLIGIFICHWVGDFLLQSRYMADNKYNHTGVLAQHCGLYMIPFVIFGWKFMLLAGILHFPVDYLTSRANHWLYKWKYTKTFFTSIGFDQMIHMIILLSVYVWLAS